jgi:hypothetical protein
MEPEIEKSSGKKKSLDVLSIKLPRSLIQGGLDNNQFGDNINDWRLQHHWPTEYFKIWKGYDSIRRDSKFTDVKSNNGNFYAEGKKITKAVNLCPSRDTGSGRSFNQSNLEACFKKNSHYFLYDREYNEKTITFIVYWVPIEYIREWYSISGNSKGKITEKKLKVHINECELSTTIIDKTKLD